MKANELMIGDWVLHHKTFNTCAFRELENPIDEYIRVESIVQEGVNEEYHQGDLDWIEWNEIEPIPLTEEILKANGFAFSQKSDDLHYRSYRLHDIVVFWRTNADNVCFAIANHSVDIHYVHELQHALRLCGLNELADNFKIE